MQIEVTENKSVGALRSTLNTVRVFVDRDYHYGHWVSEVALFEALTAEQRQAYLSSTAGNVKLDLPEAVIAALTKPQTAEAQS